jgi:3D (Asp-Asp-Asp) domain-containing protein
MIIMLPQPQGETKKIPKKVYAKGKPAKPKTKSLKRKYDDLGEFNLTAYCGCSKCCGSYGNHTSTGKKPKQGRTIAVDPKVIPYGSVVLINGKEYVAEDCGGAIKGKHIDIYFNSHADALKFGRKKEKVYIKKKPLYVIHKAKQKLMRELILYAGIFRS